MKITFDAASDSAEGSNVSSRTFSHTIGNNSNRILLVATATESNDVAVSGVTYNGVALTKIEDIFEGSEGMRIELWYLLNPAVGANNIVVTWASSVVRAYAQSLSYYNVSQIGAINAQNESNLPAPNNPLVTVTPTVSNTMLVDVAAPGSAAANLSGPNAGQTERRNASGLSTMNLGMSEKLALGPGPYTMGWVLSGGSSASTMIAVALRPVPTGAGVFLTL